jgi:serine/threonine protein kinase
MAHCDVKLANVAIDDDFNCKLIDFGFAHEKKQCANQVLGTARYMASELCYLQEDMSELNPCSSWEKTDVFSLGVVLFVLRFGNFPFKKATHLDEEYLLFCQDYVKFFRTHPLTKEKVACGEVSQDFLQLLRSLLWNDAKQRPTL